jgi:hypothetical protein
MKTKIQDFGGKIGNAAKDRATRRQSSAVDAPAPVRSPRVQKPLRFELRMDRATQKVFFCKVGDKAYRRLLEFATVAEACEFRRTPDYHESLAAAWAAARDSGNVTEDSLRGKQNAPRVGENYRHGIDIEPNQFMATFDPYGVEFGNWQTDRSACLNQAYDALRDLAGVLGMCPRDICFGGRLALAFGARGHGKAAAHYEPSRHVINLTKTAGAGCLAHEWFHAFDHSRGMFEGQTYASQRYTGEVRAALNMLPRSLVTRSRAADKTRSKTYFGQPEEIMARAFEAWVRSIASNDYLANITPVDAFGPGRACYPYPLPEEMPAVDAAMRSIFPASASMAGAA